MRYSNLISKNSHPALFVVEIKTHESVVIFFLFLAFLLIVFKKRKKNKKQNDFFFLFFCSLSKILNLVRNCVYMFWINRHHLSWKLFLFFKFKTFEKKQKYILFLNIAFCSLKKNKNFIWLNCSDKPVEY